MDKRCVVVRAGEAAEGATGVSYGAGISSSSVPELEALVDSVDGRS